MDSPQKKRHDLSIALGNLLEIKVVGTFTMNELPQLLGHLMLSVEGRAKVSEEHYGIAEFLHLSGKEFISKSYSYSTHFSIVVSSLINCRNIGKQWVGMPVLSRWRPNNFKTLLDQENNFLGPMLRNKGLVTINL